MEKFNRMVEKIDNWKSLSLSEQIEFKKAMEEAYGTQIYNNWYHVRHILLLHRKHHATVLGLSSAIFARDEYQKDAGNLCHIHLIWALDRSTLTSSRSIYTRVDKNKCFRSY